MSISNYHITKEEADAALEKHADEWINQTGIEFIAVRQKIVKCIKYYFIEYGHLEVTNRKSGFDDTIKRVVKSIPPKLEIPFWNNTNYLKDVQQRKEKKKFIKVKKVVTKRAKIALENIKPNDSEHLRLYTDCYPNGGTLGALFKLEDFKDQIFGISNWHVIKGTCGCLGDKVYKKFYNSTSGLYQKTHVGSLFWASDIKINDVAFFNFTLNSNNPKYKDILRNVPWITRTGTVSINDCVSKHGLKTNYTNGKVLSDNMSIKLDILGVDSPRIYKKQLMIEKMSDKGDSGSVLFNKNCDAVGLIYGSIDEAEVKVTLASNLNQVLNIKFISPKEVKYRNEYIKIDNFKITN